jgi:acyl-CoA thioester hydrolase
VFVVRVMYNSPMHRYRFNCPIHVRYGDLDPQWHVNNSRYLTFLEEARVAYLLHLDLWDGKSFFDIGMIVGDIHIRYLAPVTLGQKVSVDIRVAQIGNKSLTFEYQIVDEENNKILATAETVQVAFDYHQNKTIPVPIGWREKIGTFEEQDFT